jgi:hypothetical protein
MFDFKTTGLFTLSEVKELFQEKELESFFRFGGPMKCTPSGTIWCHLTCALWLPELKFGDYVKMVRKRNNLEEIYFDRINFFPFRNLF